MDTLETQSATTTATLAGGGVRASYGLTHNWELGGEFAVRVAPDLSFEHAMVGTQPGTLWANDTSAELAVDARFIFGIWQSVAFVRTHPLIGVRAGLAGRYLANQVLVDPVSGGSIATPTLASHDLTLVPFVGAELGVEHRFGRALVVGAIGQYSYGGASYSALATSIEVSWHWY